MSDCVSKVSYDVWKVSYDVRRLSYGVRKVSYIARKVSDGFRMVLGDIREMFYDADMSVLVCLLRGLVSQSPPEWVAI